MKKFFIFDIDETILCQRSSYEKIRSTLNNVPYTDSVYNPAENHGFSGWKCVTLNKEKMHTIINDISKNGNIIGFISSGGCNSDDMKKFFKEEFDVILNSPFPFYNHIYNKAECLKEISKYNSISYTDIVFIDNRSIWFDLAREMGVTVVYADNNSEDDTHGTTYIKELTRIIGRTELLESMDEINSEYKPSNSIQEDQSEQKHEFANFENSQYRLKIFDIVTRVNTPDHENSTVKTVVHKLCNVL